MIRKASQSLGKTKSAGKNKKIRKSYSAPVPDWQNDIILPDSLKPRPAGQPTKNSDDEELNQIPQYWSWRSRGREHLNDMTEFLVLTGKPPNIKNRLRKGEDEYLTMFKGNREAITFIHDQLLLEGIHSQDEINEGSVNSTNFQFQPKDVHPHNYFHYLFGRNPTEQDIQDAKHRMALFNMRRKKVIEEDIIRSKRIIKELSKDPSLNEFYNTENPVAYWIDEVDEDGKKIRVPVYFNEKWDKIEQDYEDNLTRVKGGTIPFDDLPKASKHYSAWGDNADDVYERAGNIIRGRDDSLAWHIQGITLENGEYGVVPYPSLIPINDTMKIQLQEGTDDPLTFEFFGGLETTIKPAKNKRFSPSFMSELRKWVAQMGEEERSTAKTHYRYSVPKNMEYGAFDFINAIETDPLLLKKLKKRADGKLTTLHFFNNSLRRGSNIQETETFAITPSENLKLAEQSYVKRLHEISKSTKDIKEFNNAIREKESTIKFVDSRGSSTIELRNELNKLVTEQELARTKHDAKFRNDMRDLLNNDTFMNSTLMRTHHPDITEMTIKDMGNSFALPTVEELKSTGANVTEREQVANKIDDYFNETLDYTLFGINRDIKTKKQKQRAKGKDYVKNITDKIWEKVKKDPSQQHLTRADVKLAVLSSAMQVRLDNNSKSYKLRRTEEIKDYMYQADNKTASLVFAEDALPSGRAGYNAEKHLNYIARDIIEEENFKLSVKRAKTEKIEYEDVYVVDRVGTVRGSTLQGYIQFLRTNGFELSRPQITGIGRVTNSVGSVGFVPILDERDYGGNVVQHFRSVDEALVMSNAVENAPRNVKRTALNLLAEKNHLLYQLDEKNRPMPRILSEHSYPFLAEKKSEYLRATTDKANIVSKDKVIDQFHISKEENMLRTFNYINSGTYKKEQFQQMIKEWYDKNRYEDFPDDMRILNSPMVVDTETDIGQSDKVLGYTRKSSTEQAFYFTKKGIEKTETAVDDDESDIKGTITHELLHQLGKTDFLTRDHEEAGTEIETFARTGRLKSGYIADPVTEKVDLSNKLTMDGAISSDELHTIPYYYVPQLAWDSILWKRAFLQQVIEDKPIRERLDRVVQERVTNEGIKTFNQAPTSSPLLSGVVRVEGDDGDTTVVHFNSDAEPFSRDELQEVFFLHDELDGIRGNDNDITITTEKRDHTPIGDNSDD